jgi:TRAP-type C4-dicarboxylate transport system permease small subunit
MLAILALTLMVVINAWNIVRRFLTGDDMAWVQEASPMLAMILYFLAYGLLAKQDRTIRIDFLVRRLPPRGRSAAAMAARLAGLLFQAILLDVAIRQAWFASLFRTTVLQWPETIFYLPLMLSAADILLTETILLTRRQMP